MLCLNITLTMNHHRVNTYWNIIISLRDNMARRHHSLDSSSTNQTPHTMSLSFESSLLKAAGSFLPPRNKTRRTHHREFSSLEEDTRCLVAVSPAISLEPKTPTLWTSMDLSMYASSMHGSTLKIPSMPFLNHMP